MRKPGHKCFVQVHEFPLLPKGSKRKRPDDEDDDEDDHDDDDEDDDGDQEPSRLVNLVNPLCPGTPGKDRDNRISMVFFESQAYTYPPCWSRKPPLETMNGSSRGKIVWYNYSSTWQTSTMMSTRP